MQDLLKDENAGKTQEESKPAVVAPVKQQDPREVNRQAKKELLGLIRASPNWRIALGELKNQSTDTELLNALARSDSPRGALRTAGCSTVEAAKGVRLLPLAIVCDRELPPQKQWWQKCSYQRQLTVASIVIAIGLLSGVVYLAVGPKAGWNSGLCNILMFTNSTFAKPCTGKCLFDVSVRDGSDLMRIDRWAPARLSDYREDRIVFEGEPFKCCDAQESLECCSFLDKKTMNFCDNWPGKDAPDGTACPVGNWRCLYKKDPQNDKVVKELRPDYDSPMMWNLLYAAIAFLVLAILVATSGYMKRALDICARWCLVKFKLKDLITLHKAAKERAAHQSVPRGCEKHQKMVGGGGTEDARNVTSPKAKQSRGENDSHDATVDPAAAPDRPATAATQSSAGDRPESQQTAEASSAAETLRSTASSRPSTSSSGHDKDLSRRNSRGQRFSQLAKLWEEDVEELGELGEFDKEDELSVPTKSVEELARQSGDGWFKPIINPYTPASSAGSSRSNYRGRGHKNRRPQALVQAHSRSDLAASWSWGEGGKSPTGLYQAPGTTFADDPRAWGWGSPADGHHVVDMSGFPNSPNQGPRSAAASIHSGSKGARKVNPQGLSPTGSHSPSSTLSVAEWHSVARGGPGSPTSRPQASHQRGRPDRKPLSTPVRSTV